MTSKFSKTYTRKGGEANSKFDEVFSNRKATLSTKWGETTYKAQLGAKRPAHILTTPEFPKRTRLERGDGDDPFSFDSDEELKSEQEEQELDVEPAEGVANTAPTHTAADCGSGGNAVSHPPFPAVDINPTHMHLSDYCSNVQPAHAESSRVADVLDEPKSIKVEEVLEAIEIPVDFDQLPLIKPARDRVYRRANRKAEPEPEPLQTPVNLPVSVSNCSGNPTPTPNSAPTIMPVGPAKSKAPETKGRGRVRDYTVLHPSCVSVCNVTILDSIDRSVDECVTVTPTDLGDAGAFRRKTDTPPPKYSRFRPTKSKLECKLEFFGFEDGACEGEEPEPGTSYKIKYFGFDELSESDSEEDEDEERNGRKKKKKKAAVLEMQAAEEDCSQISDSQGHMQTDPQWQDESAAAESDSQKEQEDKQMGKEKDSSRKIFKKSHTKAVYNARHWNQPEPGDAHPPAADVTPKQSVSSVKTEVNAPKDEGVFKAPPPPPKVTKSAPPPIETRPDSTTAESTELYTVVQHVKHFNDVVEFGENQEFTDDFEYLETGLKSTQALHTRCLSIISLASRCAMPSFRMHLRARGKVAQVFNLLSDAPQHPNLALCTAALLYILSRDRLNMDLDRGCLELMIRLLELEQDESENHDSKVKEKIQNLCEMVHNKHLDLHNITTGHLAMETLLSLTSKRAGDWFKEELRLLGGLDHIVDKVKECVQNLDQGADKENLVGNSLWGAERCLRVLESVTVHNPENQSYLIAYKDSQLIVSSSRALRCCESMIQLHCRDEGSDSTPGSGNHGNVGKAVEDCMRAVLGVMLNLTHDNEWGSTKTGEQDELIPTVLNCILKVPRFLPQEQRFDIRVLGLGLLINLVEYSSRNRHVLMEIRVERSLLESEKDGKMETDLLKDEDKRLGTDETSNALSALVQLFLERERAAVLAEAKADDIISEAPKPQADASGQWQVTSGEMQWVAAENSDANDAKEKEKEEEEEELDFNKVLQHAGKHMEDSIVASYTALLLGCLCEGSPINVQTVRDCLPEGDFSIMTEMLKKFLNFMNLTCAVGTTGQKSISRVIDYLEHC